MRAGCVYLDFPQDRDVQSYLSAADSEEAGVAGNGSGFASPVKVDERKGSLAAANRLFAAGLGSPRDMEIGARFTGEKVGTKKIGEVAEIGGAPADVIREEDEDD